VVGSCKILKQNNLAIHNKNSSDFAPILTYLVEGHFCTQNAVVETANLKQKEA